MILQTFAVLVALGLVVFAIGMVFDRPDVSVVGALMVIGVGAMAVQGGIQVADGHNTRVVETQVADDDIGTMEHVQSVDVSDRDASPTGLAFDDAGERMYMSGRSSGEVHWYNTSDWGLGIITHRGFFDTSAQDANLSAVAVEGDGRWLFVVGEETDSLYTYKMSEPYNVTTASPVRSFDLSTRSSGPKAVEFSNQGSDMWIVSENAAEIDHYDLSDPYNTSAASFDDSYDTSSQTAAPTGMAFGDGGTRMLISGSNDDTIYQYRLSSPYELSSASYTGNSFDAGGEVNVLGGVEYEDAGRKVLVPDTNQGELIQYDSAQTATQKETRTVYRDIEEISAFPLETIVVILGAFLTWVAAGRMSEADI